MNCCTENTPKLTISVTVEEIKSSATVDGSGNVNERLDSNWVKAGREWVEIKTRGSREFFRGRQVGEDITHQITMRYSERAAKYTNAMRLRLKGRKLNIAEPPIDVDEQGKWLIFACKEVPVL